MFKFLSNKYIKAKFRRKNLRIIENISADQFEATLASHYDQGWEMTDNFKSFNKDRERWRCKLRKGTCTLHCVWDKRVNGYIAGPQRVVDPLGHTLGKDVQEYPTMQ